MLSKSTSIGISVKEMKIVDTLRGVKTRAQHMRDNAMAYDPLEVDVSPGTNKEVSLKTSLYPIEDYIVEKRIYDSGIDFGKKTKSLSKHSYLRCVALMPPKPYNRRPHDEHKDWQKLIDEEVMTNEEVSRMVEAYS